MVATAKEIRWSATGTVTTTTGSGFPATATGTPVTVKFAYQSGATAHETSYLELPAGVPRYSSTYYYGPIGFSMEITIGANTWTADLPTLATSTPEALYAEANTNFNVTGDILRATASKGNAANFTSFPYTGTGTTRSMVITLKDTNTSNLFMIPREFPGESLRTSSLNDCSGSIKVGSQESINFTIDPASVKVTTDEPPLPLFISRTPEGIKLRWPSEIGKVYMIKQCENFPDWDDAGVEVGTGTDIEVLIATPQQMGTRRFYRVISD